ncbi:uncharacterized protein LOC134741147 [Cydia strobilella]|uniref:uncharacterized protein LOC134741147 n=1 Tax=Cydia strobilella TaxID=1100964 RepID=UPI003004162C
MGVGKIPEFDVKAVNWTMYCERLEMYFLANDIKDAVKLPTVIAVMGEDAYHLLSTLASPAQPSTLTFTNAVTLLKNHLQPKPSILAERYRFRQRRQAEGESVAEYVAELKKLAKTCDFGTTLEDNLRDQLVCGIVSESTRQRLFAEDGIDYSRAVSLATTLEAAEKNAVAVDRDAKVITGVHKLEANHKCMACGEIGHKTEGCKYKNFECSWCKNLGHLRRMCSEKNARFGVTETAGSQSQSRGDGVIYNGSGARGNRSAERGGSGRGPGRGGRSGRRGTNNYWVQAHQASADVASDNSGYTSALDHSCDLDEDNEPMYQISLSKYKPA